MKVITETNQAQCKLVLTELKALEVWAPMPPATTADGMMQLGPGAWLVGTNTDGVYVLHLLTDATEKQAWEFFNNLRGPNTRHINLRLTIVGASHPAAN